VQYTIEGHEWVHTQQKHLMELKLTEDQIVLIVDIKNVPSSGSYLTTGALLKKNPVSYGT
jgi:hypothetical protein